MFATVLHFGLGVMGYGEWVMGMGGMVNVPKYG